MMKNRKFAVFILSHNRAENVKTYETLKKCGYTGDVYIIIDTTDKQIELYQKKFPEQVIIFDKKEVAKETDTLDNFNKMNIVVYARNECHKIAERLGLTHFLVLDDDYSDFAFRYEKDSSLKNKKILDLDRVNNMMLDFLDISNALTVTMAQAGDFIGGLGSANWRKKLLRKAMNSFYCRTDRPFKFMGTTNEDVNAYVLHGSKGNLFFTICDVMLNQTKTQANKGGLTDIYLEQGTYIKSFYSVIVAPSCVKVVPMGDKHYRLHHKISWNNAVPLIVNEKFKK